MRDCVPPSASDLCAAAGAGVLRNKTKRDLRYRPNIYYHHGLIFSSLIFSFLLGFVTRLTVRINILLGRYDRTTMALLFLKSVLFPNVKAKNYSLLPNDHDSRESSFDSSSRNEALNEKLNDKNAASKTIRWKIDPRIISDATIGLSDGLTVPFALTAGLSALGDTNVVIYGGLAELIAGGISMGLGGYLGARSES